MHPGMKENKKQDTVIKKAADRLSRPKNTDVKPVKKKNLLADLLDADDYAPPSSGYDTYDSSAVATALNGTPGSNLDENNDLLGMTKDLNDWEEQFMKEKT